MEYALLGAIVGGLWALLLWLSIIVWVYRDVRDRTRDMGLQVLAVFVVLMFFPGFNIPGLVLYLMLRPRDTLDEVYVRSLEEEALLKELGEEGYCPSCRRMVEREYLVCAYCRTQLREPCSQCQRLLSLSWVVCPYCGTDREKAKPAVEALQQPAAEGGVALSSGGSDAPEGVGRPGGSRMAPQEH